MEFGIQVSVGDPCLGKGGSESCRGLREKPKAGVTSEHTVCVTKRTTWAHLVYSGRAFIFWSLSHWLGLLARTLPTARDTLQELRAARPAPSLGSVPGHAPPPRGPLRVG